jgi:hypothetical protein
LAQPCSVQRYVCKLLVGLSGILLGGQYHKTVLTLRFMVMALVKFFFGEVAGMAGKVIIKPGEL